MDKERGIKMKKQFSAVKKEIESLVVTMEKRDAYNTQVIEELDKLLNIAKYGSVGHANKVVRLSTLRNYKLRLGEVIQMFKEFKDLEAIQSMITVVESMATDSKTNLKAANDSLGVVEIFSNDYMKNEILAKTYKDLFDLYTEVGEFLKKLVEEDEKQPEPEMPMPEAAIPIEEKAVKKSASKENLV